MVKEKGHSMYKRVNLFGKFKLKQKSSNVMAFELFCLIMTLISCQLPTNIVCFRKVWMIVGGCFMKSILIKDTTKEEREEIIKSSLDCDGGYLKSFHIFDTELKQLNANLI